MLNVEIKHQLGSYVKTNKGEIFEIVQIAINVVFNNEIMKEEITVCYLAVDPRLEWGETNLFLDQEIKSVGDTEVEDYILYSQGYEVPQEQPEWFQAQEQPEWFEAHEQNKYFQEQEELELQMKFQALHPSEYLFGGSTDQVQSLEKKERTIDNILDETLDYRGLIEHFGDEDGEYKQRLYELSKEFKQAVVERNK